MEKFKLENLDLLDALPDKKRDVLREIRQPYIEAYNITLNNHKNGARKEDLLTDSEYQEITSWFNELRDVTDTFDLTVFDRTPIKVLKHVKETVC